MNAEAPIGVFDSGIGGFTVARQLRRLMPRERIVYYGDSAYQPYGSRPTSEILRLTRQMLAFMCGRRVKAVAVACNTISTLIDAYRDGYPFPIFSVIEAGAAVAARLDAACVGVIGTPVTARSGAYERLIRAARPEMRVVTCGCPNLSRHIDAGDLSPETIDPELREAVDALQAQAPIRHLILGCTHYPLVADHLTRLYPGLELIDPALEQARVIRDSLAAAHLLRGDGEGGVELNTSGSTELYAAAADKFGLTGVSSVNALCVTNPE